MTVDMGVTGGELHVQIAGDPQSAIEWISEKLKTDAHVEGGFDDTAGFCVVSGRNVGIWIHKRGDCNVIAHESLHAASGIGHYLGIDHEEFAALVAGFVAEEIHKAGRKR